MPHSRSCRPRGWLAALCLAAALSGCAEGDASPGASGAARALVVPDDAGRTVALDAPARRVLSLIPAHTEVIHRLAGPAVLVGRTVWDEDPALAHLPSTGNALAPSVEWIVALRPDLVVAWPDQASRSLIARLEGAGVPVYASSVETLADIDTMIARLGLLLGRTDAADSLAAALHAELAAVRAGVAGRARPRVLYAVSIDPPMAVSGDTYLGELIALAGGDNIFADLDMPWPQVSLEEVVRRQPEVIIRPVASPGEDVLATLRRRPGWRELPAVRSGRVHAVDVNLLNRPGPRIGEAARVLARALHPDAGGAP